MSVDLADADGYLVATIDDGKANALSFDLIDAIRSAIASASDRGQPLVITGRDGCFSAGFDLAVMNGGDKETGRGAVLRRRRLYRGPSKRRCPSWRRAPGTPWPGERSSC